MSWLRLLPVLAAVALLSATLPLRAQDSNASLYPPGLDPASLQVRLQEVQTAGHLDDAQRAELVGLYQSAIERVERRKGWLAEQAEYERFIAEAPAQLEAIRARMAADVGELVAPEIPEGLGVAEMEQRANQAEAEFAAAQAELDRLADERRLRDGRRVEVPLAMTEVRARLTSIEGELAVEAPTPEDPAAADVARARTQLLKARRMAAQAELAALDFEIRSYDERRDLLSAKRDEAARAVLRAGLAARAWRDGAIAAREQEALAVAEQARLAAEAAANEHAVLRVLADENRDLAERRTGPDGLVAHIRENTTELARIRALLDDVRARSASVRSKYAAAPNTSTIGLLLVSHRSELPDVREQRARQESRQEEAAEIQLRLIETREALASLVEIDERMDELVVELRKDVPEGQLDALLPTGRARLETRRSLYADLEDDYRVYVDLLADLDVAQGQLITVTEAFQEYIDERVLWVRVLPPMHLDPHVLGDVIAGLAWLSDPVTWAAVFGDAIRGMGRSPGWTVLPLLLVAALFLMKPRLRRTLGESADAVGRIRTDRFSLTLRSLLDTLLLAAPWPLALWWSGRLLVGASRMPGAATLCAWMGPALQTTAGVWLAIEFAMRACRDRGLFEAHFRYPEQSLQRVRRRLVPFSLVFLPALTVELAATSAGFQALGRTASVVGVLALVWLLATVLRPSQGVLAPLLTRNPDGWLSRTRWLWYLAGVGLPITLIALVEMGYVYTAEQIEQRLHQTLLLAAAVGMGNALVLRALFVARRRLAIQQYERRKQAALEEQRGEGEGHELPDDEIDVAAINEQGRRLVTAMAGVVLVAGSWLIWSDVLPALRVLDEVPLWSRTVDVVERIPGVGGDPEQVMVIPTSVPVTVADGLLAVVWVLLTVVAARNGPGLLEITVLQHLPMQRAGRYAVTTVARYMITVLGSLGAFGALGIGWNEVQWLAAAVSVGLGFGLQEIFANFVSGLILLLERPVRVGDTVTVGSVTGTVARIHMRATTIVTWDETELVVPNKDFITSQLVNWTLSSSVLRVIVKVGIAYGSDTELATRLLKRVAHENKDVLDDPPVRVVFTSFGDSALDFEMRCYVDTPELFRHIHHDLNMAIDRLFREHGISIAFPQRDLHLKTSDAVFNVRYQRDDGGALGGPPGEPVPSAGPSPDGA